MGLLCVVEMYSHGLIYKLSHPDLEIYNPAVLNRATVFFVFCFWPAFHVLRAWPGEAKKYLQIILMALVAAILVKTDSQSAQMAFLFSAPFYFIFPAGRRWAWYMFGGALIAAFWLSPWIAQALFEQMAPAISDIELFRRSYAANRMEIWDFVASRALESPIYGHGVEATRAITDFETDRIYHKHNIVLHPHNFALQIWIEFGALGIAAFSALIGGALVKLRALPVHSARLWLACLVAGLSVASTGYGLWQSWWVGALCVCAALCIWASRAYNQK